MQQNRPSNYVIKTASVPPFLLWFLITLAASYIAMGHMGLATGIILVIGVLLVRPLRGKLIVRGENCTYVPVLGKRIHFSMDDLKEIKIEPAYSRDDSERLAFYRKDGNWICEMPLVKGYKMQCLLDSLHEKGIINGKVPRVFNDVWKEDAEPDPEKERITILILGICTFVQTILLLVKIDSFLPTIFGLCWILFVFFDRWRGRLKRLKNAYAEADIREGVITGFHQPEGRVVSYPCFRYEDEEGEHEKESYYGFKIPEEEKEKYIGKKYIIRCSDEMNVVFFLSGEDKREKISETYREGTVVRYFLTLGETKNWWRTMPKLDEELKVDETK